MLGENIYNLRKSKKLSQEQLAEQVRVTRQTISNWELGETSPNPEQLKLLSKVLNVSVDELLNNDVKSDLVEKVSNTEKLAGIIIKILKVIGVAFLVMLIIDIVAFLLFVFVRKETTSSSVESVTLNCSIDEKDYLISVESDSHFNCSNCSKEVQNDVKELIDYSDISKTAKDIEKYFIDKNGLCE